MKTANVYEIERALQQPITPQQRQTAAANNPVAALLAQRLDGVEGSLRTKMQTPPPPQGTVMNQYYQWPQQQPEMGLAQPGLEQMAQQYASGGLVAFADGGPVYDVDGGDAYADGGLATMLPMGYADEDDMPIYGYSQGEEVKLHQYPWRTLGESVEPIIVDDTAEDEDAFWEDMPDVDKLEAQRIRERPTPSASDTAGMSNDQPWPINPSAIQHPGFDRGRGYLSEIGDKISAAEQAIGERIKGAGQRWSERLAPITDKYSAREKEVQRLEGLPAAYAAAMESGAPMPSVYYEPTLSGEDRKRQQQQEENTAKQQERVDALEASNKQKKATPVSSANPVRSEGPGTSMLSPAAWSAERGAGLTPSSAEYSAGTPTVVTDGQIDEVNLDPNRNAGAAAIVNSGLSTDQQIAALAKYFQTDTSEAMRIKGEMEKENAHAGNVGIMAALANALGLGLGTYGTGAARWGAGLAGMAQGLMSEEDRAAKRQASINELGLKIKEMEGSGTRKAAETILKKREAAAERKQKLEDQLALEQVKGGYREKVANIGAGASMRNKDVDVANRGAGGLDQAKYAHILAEAEKGAADYIKANYTDQGKPTPPGIYDQVRQRLIQERLGQVGSVPQMSVGTGGGSVTPDLVVGPRTSRGMFDPTRGFTAYQ